MRDDSMDMALSMNAVDMGIADILDHVASLSPEESALFHRLFRVSIASGGLHPPESMHPWIQQQFGSVEAVLQQKIIRVINQVTVEDVLFNEIRSQRPHQLLNHIDLEGTIQSDEEDPLADPVNGTPEDIFGRIRGRYCVTASNVAKMDGFSGLVVFDKRNPLDFTREEIADYLEVAERWAQTAHGLDAQAKYPFFLWNCLWRAGASLPHGHAQVALSRDAHYGKIEHLRRSAQRYREEDGSDYFQDFARVHRALGCGFEKEGVQVLAHLVPLKEKETILLADGLHASLKERIYEVLACFRDQMGVTSFNLAIALPPLGPTEEDWQGFPVLVRVVDRGDYHNRSSDIGGMELYATSVVSADPFQVAQTLRESMLSIP